MKLARRRATYPIRTAREIEALASPVRQEVVDGLQALGSASIAELAESLGRAPDSLYYHVKHLERVGLVVRAGTRGEGRRAEALFATPGRLVLDHQPATERQRRSVVKLVAAALRMAERDLRAAFDSGLAVFRRCAARNAWGARTKGWLTRSELAEVREHLEAASRILATSRKRRGTSLQALTFVLTPLAPSPRAGRGTTKEAR